MELIIVLAVAAALYLAYRYLFIEKHADLNKDGKVDVKDANIAAKEVVKKVRKPRKKKAEGN